MRYVYPVKGDDSWLAQAGQFSRAFAEPIESGDLVCLRGVRHAATFIAIAATKLDNGQHLATLVAFEPVPA